MVATLKTLKNDETMLVQSAKPVGVFRTNEWAPRVLIANSNLVGDWANWEEFRRLEDLGLTMYGQMTAGSWIYIGTQGILQGTYETFGAIAKKRYNGSLAGTITLTAGLGGMGGAQPLAVTMNDGVAICVDCDITRIDRRIAHKYLDTKADSIEHALELATAARDAKKPLSIGLEGNAAEIFPALLEMKAPIDIVTDQTSAHDPLAYLPIGIDFGDMKTMSEKDPQKFTEDSRNAMAAHVKAMVGFMDAGAEVFDYGNSIPRRGPQGRLRPCIRLPRIRSRLHPSTLPKKASAPSAGQRSRVIPRTSRPPTRPSSNSSPRTSTCAAGSPWPAKRLPSKAFRLASAGSDTVSATSPASSSTRWWPRASSPHRSPSAAITSTPDRSPRRTAKPNR